LILVAFAATLLVFPNSERLLLVSSTSASVIAIIDTVRLFWVGHNIRFSSILALVILATYASATSAYWFVTGTFQGPQAEFWRYRNLVYASNDIAKGLAYCFLSSSVLYLFSYLEKPFNQFLRPWRYDQARAVRLIWAGALVVGIAVIEGQLKYGGSYVGDNGHVSPLGILSDLLVPVLLPFTLVSISQSSSARQKFLLTLLGIFFLSILIFLGRRNLIFSLATTAVVLVGTLGVDPIRKILYGALFGVSACVLIFIGFHLFFYVRVAAGPSSGQTDVFDAAYISGSSSLNKEGDSTIGKLSENIFSRPYILSYFAGLINASEGEKFPLRGKELIYASKMTIPSIFWPEKLKVSEAYSEALVHPKYGLPVFDGANSIVVTGYNDFGVAGSTFYPVFLVLFYVLFWKATLQLVRTDHGRLLIVLSLVYQVLNIEATLTAQFTSLRNLLLMVAAIIVLDLAPVLGVKLSKKPP